MSQEHLNTPGNGNFNDKYDKVLFWPILLVYSAILLSAVFVPEFTGSFFGSIQNYAISNLSWLIVLTGGIGVLFVYYLGFSQKYAKVKLGKPEDKPEFSFFAWIAMLFCAALGTGFVIYGVSEPINHLFTIPTIVDAGQVGKEAAVPEAIRATVVHWALYTWAIYGLGGWAIGYAAYKYDKPIRSSTGLYGILGDRANSHPFGRIVDILAGIATVGGVSMMLGLGMASISYACFLLFGITLTTIGKVAVMAFLVVAYIISTATGIARGMRLLSESATYICFGLLLIVLFFGDAPVSYLLNLTVETTGAYIVNIPETLFWTDAVSFKPREWMGWWFIFFIMWTIGYLPFTSVFIARISRGRTLREYVFGVVLIPTIATIIWFSLWGGSASFAEISGLLPMWETVQAHPEQGVYLLLKSLPFGLTLCFVVFVCFLLFAITTADAASFCVAQQVTKSQHSPGLAMRVLWGLVIGFTGTLFQVIGGVNSMKSLAVVAALPLFLIVFAYIISILKMFRNISKEQ